MKVKLLLTRLWRRRTDVVDLAGKVVLGAGLQQKWHMAMQCSMELASHWVFWVRSVASSNVQVQQACETAGPTRASTAVRPRAASGIGRRAGGSEDQTPHVRAAGGGALEYARHGRSIGGGSPLGEEVVLTPSRRQLRRREAGWEGSPRRNPAPRYTNRVEGGAIWVSLLKKVKPVTIKRVVA